MHRNYLKAIQIWAVVVTILAGVTGVVVCVLSVIYFVRKLL